MTWGPVSLRYMTYANNDRLFAFVNSCPERPHLSGAAWPGQFFPNGSRRYAQSTVLLLKLHYTPTSGRHHRSLPTIPKDSRQHCGTGKRFRTWCKTVGFNRRMGKEHSLFHWINSPWSVHLITLMLEWTFYTKHRTTLLSISHGTTADHKCPYTAVEQRFVSEQ